MSPDPITLESLQARMSGAGVSLDPNYLEALATLMEGSLSPLRRLDPDRLRSVEPLVTVTLSLETADV